MCGNGIRCVAKYVFDHGLCQKSRMTIETGAGILALDVEEENGKVQQVRVDMGEPILLAAEIPTTLAGNPEVNHYVINVPCQSADTNLLSIVFQWVTLIVSFLLTKRPMIWF